MGSNQKQHVLIVDDSDFELAVLQKMLSELDVELLCASSGEDALALLGDNEVALVLMDVHMQGISGMETASRMRQESALSQVPIIFITGTEISQEQIGEGYGVGAVDYLLKPVNPVWLRSKVRVFCELSRQRTVIQDQLKLIRNSHEVLQQQLEEIKELRGFIPICANCKKVRNDGGYWENLEQYISDHSGAEFSHSVCPTCTDVLYPELAK
jgi:phosphoserine phosphatase RsbU/P